MIVTLKSGHLALRCDGCGARFVPRVEAIGHGTLRNKAHRQGWAAVGFGDSPDYCSNDCVAAARAAEITDSTAGSDCRDSGADKDEAPET